MADSFITLGTRVDNASLQQSLRQINAAMTSIEKRKVNLSLDSGKFTRPLGKITGATNEFTKSLEASNARVLAFGASAGAIFQVQRAFEFLLKSTIQVEKQLQDVNVILGESERGLAKFGKSLFNIAGKTAQSINTVADAATELARQGLSTEETLRRTNDALILTRLSGMEAAASVSSLTAALNTFNKEALNSTQVINKLANVDAAFAVSTDDLAQAMRRVGNTAQDVGVSFDQLLAITASVQQTTARGGPVIGNALKSIFTRIQRRDTLDLLERLGVTVRDLEGQMMPAMMVLGNLAKRFPALSKAQQAHTAEVVAGVFQMNNLRAILSDLGKEFSIYDKAVKVSTNSTNEAIIRNELLNKTLDAQVKKTMALATQAAKKVGDLTLRPVTERVVGIMQKVLGDINEKDTKDVGGKIATGILAGLGNFLAGPGLLLITGFIGKLGINLAKFVKESGAQFMGLNTAAVQQKNLQESIAKILEKHPSLIAKAASSTEGRVQAERKIIGMLEQETNLMLNMEKVANRMAAMMVRGGVTVGAAGNVTAPKWLRPRGAAGGHVPSFNRSGAIAEAAGAAMGGYKAGATKQMNMPGVGPVTYNSRETVRHIPGFAQPLINPPMHSRAGRQHRQNAISRIGVDPYGGTPNYAALPVNIFGRGLTIGTRGTTQGSAKALSKPWGAGKFHRELENNPVLTRAYGHALAGHGGHVRAVVPKVHEIQASANAMSRTMADAFLNSMVGKQSSWVKQFGTSSAATSAAKNIIYTRNGHPRSWQEMDSMARETLTSKQVGSWNHFSGKFSDNVIAASSSGALLPLGLVRGAKSSDTVLDAFRMEGGKVSGAAEFKPHFVGSGAGRDSRYSLAYKSLFTSESGTSGLLKWLRDGMNNQMTRLGGANTAAGGAVKKDLEALNSYMVSAKAADFQRYQKLAGGEITLGGQAQQVSKIFGPDAMKILGQQQLKPSAQAAEYDRLMKLFGASGGYIPSYSAGGGLAAAFNREKEQSGLPLSKLYATTVKTPNYSGPVVANMRDEPNESALIKAVKGHPNPSKAGMAALGHIPNYADSVDYMGLTSGMMMAGMMMQMSAKTDDEKQAIRDQKQGFKDAKAALRDREAKTSRIESTRDKTIDRQRAHQVAQQQEMRRAEALNRERQAATKESLRLTHGDKRVTSTGQTVREGGTRQLRQQIIEREQRRAIMKQFGTAGGGSQQQMYKQLRIFESQAKYGTQAQKGPLAEARQAGERRAQRIMAMATTDRGAPGVRGAKGIDIKGDKLATQLSERETALKQAQQREANLRQQQTAAQQSSYNQKEQAIKQEKLAAKQALALTAAREKEVAAMSKMKELKPPSLRARASDFIKSKGFGVGIAGQMIAGVAEQFVGGQGVTPEERAEKAKVRGVGTALGMAGTGAMIGGPWGAAAGLALGAGLGYMDWQKASKKGSEDYARALQKETEARKQALVGAEAYTKLQTRMTGMISRGAGPAEMRNMQRIMRESLMKVEDPQLRSELVASAGDIGKMREAMAKVQEQVAVDEKKGMVGILSAKATEASKGSERAAAVKDLAKTLSGAFDITGVNMTDLIGKAPEEMETALVKMGVGAGQAAAMVEQLTGEHEWMIRAAMQEAAALEELEEEANRSAQSIQRMASATNDLNALTKQISINFKHLAAVTEIAFKSSFKVSDALNKSIAGDDTIGQGRRNRFGLSQELLKNIEQNTFQNLMTSKSFHDNMLEFIDKDTRGGTGILSKSKQALQEFARTQLAKGGDLTPDVIDRYKELMGDPELGRKTQQEMVETLTKNIHAIEENNLKTSENNRLLIIQHRLAEMERAFRSRRALQQGLLAGGVGGELGIIGALEKMMKVRRLPTAEESRRAAKGRIEGIRDLEKMGFNFADSVGKAQKEAALREANRAEAPGALRALGMSQRDVAKIVGSGFDPKTAEELINKTGSANAELMAQVVDAANLGRIAAEERKEKRALLEAEHKSRNAMIEALGGNIDSIALLIGSNMDLIDSHEKLTREAWNQVGARGDQIDAELSERAIQNNLQHKVMAASTASFANIMGNAVTNFSHAMEMYAAQQAGLTRKINIEKAFNDAMTKGQGFQGLIDDFRASGPAMSVALPRDVGENSYLAGQNVLGSKVGSGPVARGLQDIIGFGKSYTLDQVFGDDRTKAESRMVSEAQQLEASPRWRKFAQQVLGPAGINVMTGAGTDPFGLANPDTGQGPTTRTDGSFTNRDVINFEAAMYEAGRGGVPWGDKVNKAAATDLGQLKGGIELMTAFEAMGPILKEIFPNIEPGDTTGIPIVPNVERWQEQGGQQLSVVQNQLTKLRTTLSEQFSEDWELMMMAHLTEISKVKELLQRDKGFTWQELKQNRDNLVSATLAVHEMMFNFGELELGPKLPQSYDKDQYEASLEAMRKDIDLAKKLLTEEIQSLFTAGRQIKPSEARAVMQQIEMYKRILEKPTELFKATEKFNTTGTPRVNPWTGGTRGTYLEFFEQTRGTLSAPEFKQNTLVTPEMARRHHGGSMTPQVSIQSGVVQPGEIDLRARDPKSVRGEIPVRITDISSAAKSVLEKGASELNVKFLQDFGGWSAEQLKTNKDIVHKIQDFFTMSRPEEEWSKMADQIAQPMLSIQQTIEELNELNKNPNLSKEEKDQQSAVIQILSSILAEMIQEGSKNEIEAKELRDTLKLLPKEHAEAIEALERQRERQNVDEALERARKTVQAAGPLPLNLATSAIAGNVAVGAKQTATPFTNRLSESFIGRGKHFLEQLLKEEDKKYQDIDSPAIPKMKAVLATEGIKSMQEAINSASGDFPELKSIATEWVGQIRDLFELVKEKTNNNLEQANKDVNALLAGREGDVSFLKPKKGEAPEIFRDDLRRKAPKVWEALRGAAETESVYDIKRQNLLTTLPYHSQRDMPLGTLDYQRQHGGQLAGPARFLSEQMRAIKGTKLIEEANVGFYQSQLEELAVYNLANKQEVLKRIEQFSAQEIALQQEIDKLQTILNKLIAGGAAEKDPDRLQLIAKAIGQVKGDWEKRMAQMTELKASEQELELQFIEQMRNEDGEKIFSQRLSIWKKTIDPRSKEMRADRVGFANPELKARGDALKARIFAGEVAEGAIKQELDFLKTTTKAGQFEGWGDTLGENYQRPEGFGEWVSRQATLLEREGGEESIALAANLRNQIGQPDPRLIQDWQRAESKKKLQPGSRHEAAFNAHSARQAKVPRLQTQLAEILEKRGDANLRLGNLTQLSESFLELDKALNLAPGTSGKPVGGGGLAPYEFQMLMQSRDTLATQRMAAGAGVQGIMPAVLPTRLGERQQQTVVGKLKEVEELEQRRLSAEPERILAEQKLMAAQDELHAAEEDKNAATKYKTDLEQVAQLQADVDKARKLQQIASANNDKAALEDATANLNAAKTKASAAQEAHQRENARLIFAHQQVEAATKDRNAAAARKADTELILSRINDEYGSVSNLVIRLMKQYEEAEFTKTMEEMDNSMAALNIKFRMLADSDKWDALLKSTTKLTEMQLRLAAKQAQLNEQAGITTPQDTYQRNMDLTRQQLRTGNIGVFEAFGLETGFSNEAAQRGWKEQLLNDLVDIRENMISSFAEGWKAFSQGGADADDVLKDWLDSFLNSINQAFYNLTLGRLMRATMSGDFSSYFNPGFSNPQPRQKGGTMVPGSGSGDTVPAMLEPGEYVLNRNAVRNIGKNNLDYLNFNQAPRFQEGGFTPPRNLPRNTWPKVADNAGAHLFRGREFDRNAGAPPEWHDRQTTLEFYKFWNKPENKKKLHHRMTPWLQAKSDSQRIRKLFNASGIGEVEMSDVVIPGGNLGGFKAVKRPPIMLGGKLGPGWDPDTGQWKGLPGNQEAARDELSEFARAHPEALQNFAQSWVKRMKGWQYGPQRYQDGGPVISNYQKAWERKLGMHQMLRVSGAIPSTGFFGQPLHQQGPMTEDQLAIALQERKKAWEKQNPNWTGLKPDFSLPRGDEYHRLSPEAIKRRAELESQRKIMARLNLEHKVNRRMSYGSGPGTGRPARSYDLSSSPLLAGFYKGDSDHIRPNPISRRAWQYTFARENNFYSKKEMMEPNHKMAAYFATLPKGYAENSDKVHRMITDMDEGHPIIPMGGSKFYMSVKGAMKVHDLKINDAVMLERLRGQVTEDYNERVLRERGLRGLWGDPNLTSPLKHEKNPPGLEAKLAQRGDGNREMAAWHARSDLHENLLRKRLLQRKGNAWYNKFIQSPENRKLVDWRAGQTPSRAMILRRQIEDAKPMPLPPGPIQIDPATGLPIGGGLDDNATGLGLPGPIPGGFPQMIPKFNMGGHVGPNLPAEFSDDDIRKVEKMMRERIDRDEAVRRQKLIREAQKQLKDATKKSGGKGIKHTHPKPKGGLSPKKFSKPMGPIKGPGGPGGRMNMLMMAPGILNELFWNRKDGWNLNVPKNIKDAWQRGKEAPGQGPRLGGVIEAAEGGVIGIHRNNAGQALYDRLAGTTGMTGMDPYFKVNQKSYYNPWEVVNRGFVHSFNAQDTTTAGVIYGETGPGLYRQMDVVGNTLRNRVSSPNFAPAETSVFGAATERGQFDAYNNRRNANWAESRRMTTFMNGAEFKKKDGTGGWVAFRKKFGNTKTKAWQSALFYGSNKGQVSGRYGGITAYTSPVRGLARTVPNETTGLTPFGLGHFAHQETAGGINVGAARLNVGGVGFHTYTSPVGGDYGRFSNEYTRNSARQLGSSSFAPFLQRIINPRIQAATSRNDIGRLWRGQGGHRGWVGLSAENKLEANERMARDLYVRQGVGSSASRRFLLALGKALPQLPERRARGGMIRNGSGVRDDVPAMLQKGEFVMKQDSVNKYGEKFFKNLNEGRVKFQSGGVVTDMDEAAAVAQDAVQDDEEQGKRNPPSLNEQYGIALGEAWHGAPGDFKMEGIATQDKVWYGGGHSPGQAMQRTAEEAEKGFSFGGPNMFAYNDPERPSLGKFFVDEEMSMYAMEDSNNPQNEFRNKREKLFVDYKQYLKDEYENRKKQWDAFKKKKKQMLTGAWIQFGIQMASVGAQAYGQKANEKYGTPEQVAEDPTQFKSMEGVENVEAGDFVNEGMNKSWGKVSAFASSPMGSSLIAGSTTALVGWGMGASGEQIALTAGTAMASAAVSSYARIKGNQKAVQNELNNANPNVANAALREHWDTLTPEQRAAAQDRIKMNEATFPLQQMKLEIKRNEEQKEFFEKVQAGFGPDKWDGEAWHKNKDRLDEVNEKLENSRTAMNRWGNAHPKYITGNEQAGWTSNAQEAAKLERVKLNWSQAKKASIDRKNAIENAAKHRDALGQALRRPFALGGTVDGSGVDDVAALLTKGEYVLNKQTVDRVGLNNLNAMNQGLIPQRNRFANGGAVGMQDSQFTAGANPVGVGGPAMADEGLNDSLIQLIDIVQGIRERVEEEADTKSREKVAGENNTNAGGAGDVNQEIVNNVSINISIAKDGSATADTDANTEGGGKQGEGEEEEDDQERAEKFADLMQGVALQTIVEEQRPGGLLYK